MTKQLTPQTSEHCDVLQPLPWMTTSALNSPRLSARLRMFSADRQSVKHVELVFLRATDVQRGRS
jgi:hypothetical protein